MNESTILAGVFEKVDALSGQAIGTMKGVAVLILAGIIIYAWAKGGGIAKIVTTGICGALGLWLAFGHGVETIAGWFQSTLG